MERRVRSGCISCRARHVKCDEAKPSCERCRTGGFFCEGYSVPKYVSLTRRSLPTLNHNTSRPQAPTICPGLSWRHPNWRQEQLPLFHQFVTITAARLFRKDHISFWRNEVAQLSYGLDYVYEALLAVGAVHRSSLLNCQIGTSREAVRFRVLGFRAYGNALRLLSGHLTSARKRESIALLITLMLLTYFESLLGNCKGAFRHLWAAIQVLREYEEQRDIFRFSISKITPLIDTIIHLDFVAQKAVPYAGSSYLRYSDAYLMEPPYWSRPSPGISTISQVDCIAAERYSLIRLLCGYNKLNRILWACLCPLNEQPSRAELLAFYTEMRLWKERSPATFSNYGNLESCKATDFLALDSLPMPPKAYHFSSSETALTIATYNGYLGCTTALLSVTDPDSATREVEVYNLVYSNLRIAAGLIDGYNCPSDKSYKPSEAVNFGIAAPLYQGAHRCFSLAWQKYTIDLLRSIGHEGLFNGFTAANTIEILCQLDDETSPYTRSKLGNAGVHSYLGRLCDRTTPLLLPREDDGQLLAFFLRSRPIYINEDKLVIRVVAKAKWTEDDFGSRKLSIFNVYDSTNIQKFQTSNIPEVINLFNSWRQVVKYGWHEYLQTDVKDGFPQEIVIS